jgi:branched-chain amino acid transport system substrate-binding protein
VKIARNRAFLAVAAIAGFAIQSGAQTPSPVATPGVTPTEIKIGNITCAAGRAAAYAAVPRAEAAYFAMINAQGGINGRKINFVSRDTGCDPSATLALTKKLVEDEQVLLLFSVLGTENNLAIRDYLNQEQIPQLFVETSSAQFNDPGHFPWTMGFFATFHSEAAAYARYILQNKPDAKIAILSSSDDVGREFLAGVHETLGPRASAMIVKEATYETGASSPNAQLQALKSSGANVFLNFSIGQVATQTIRAAYDLDWHPLQFIPNASLSTAAFLEPAGLEKAKNVISNARSKGWLRDRAATDPAVQEFLDWMHQYNPDANPRDQNNVAGYERAQTLVAVLKACGKDISRANVMKQAANLDLQLGMLRAGIRIKTTPTDYQPIKQLFLIQFDGKDWNALTVVEAP